MITAHKAGVNGRNGTASIWENASVFTFFLVMTFISSNQRGIMVVIFSLTSTSHESVQHISVRFKATSWPHCVAQSKLVLRDSAETGVNSHSIP